MPGRGYWGATKPPAGVGLDFSHPLARGLVSWWTFNEGGGQRAADLTARGPGFGLSAAGAAAWAGSPYGRGWKFTGSAGHYAVQRTDTLPNPATSDLTMAVLVQVARNGTTEAYLSLEDQAASANGLAIGQRGGSFFGVEGRGTGSTPNLVSTVVPVIGRPYLLVFTRRGTTNTLYINGVFNVTNTSTPQSFVPYNVFLNAFNVSFDPASGTTSLAGIWNRALSPTEQQALWAAPFDLLLPPAWRRRAPSQQYLISPSGTVTPTGTLVKRDNKVAAGTITPTGALIPLGVKPKSMSGTVTPAGVLAQRANKALAGVITPVGILIKQGRKTLAGTLAPAGATAAFRVTLLALSGVVAPAGTLAKTLGKVAAGSITPAGVLAALKTTLLSLVGVLRPTAATVITGHIVPIVPNGLGVTVQTSDDHARRTTLETEG